MTDFFGRIWVHVLSYLFLYQTVTTFFRKCGSYVHYNVITLKHASTQKFTEQKMLKRQCQMSDYELQLLVSNFYNFFC